MKLSCQEIPRGRPRRDRNRGPDEGSWPYRGRAFYKHLKSRDALVAEAIGSALEMWKDRIDAAAAGSPRITSETPVDDHLSEAHRNHPGIRVGLRRDPQGSVKQIHHEELETGDKERPSAFPKIMLKQTDSGIQQLHGAGERT